MKKLRPVPELEELIESIDISDANYEKATNRYYSIVDYISDSELSNYRPDIFLQGSIKLGTAIKPLTNDGNYDVDIVCNFTGKHMLEQSQEDLKNLLGKYIKSYMQKHSMKKEPYNGNRCWTIEYSDDVNFHVDILPSVLYGDSQTDDIAITDKRHHDFNNLSNSWEISNPKGYYKWFRAQSNFDHYKEEYKRLNQIFEEFPEYTIKTPLQRIVQLLKRHAEVCFENELEYKPSSIIITTLAAKSYQKVVSKSETFEELLENVILHLIEGIDNDSTNRKCVLNPVNEKENLSTKWSEDERYFKKFLYWLEQLYSDFSTNIELSDSMKMFYIRRSIDNKNFNIGIDLKELSYYEKSEWSELVFLPISISASFRQGNIRRRIKSGEVISKNGDIDFELIGNFPPTYDIYWKVTNTGMEATNANCLRGNYFKGKRFLNEKTSYFGRHYVEAYIVNNNICYGKTSPFEVNITNTSFSGLIN